MRHMRENGCQDRRISRAAVTSNTEFINKITNNVATSELVVPNWETVVAEFYRELSRECQRLVKITPRCSFMTVTYCL